MSKALAALFGGLAGGASSLGSSRMREQEINQFEQRRMNELRQQESARLAQTREAAQLREGENVRKRAAGVNTIQALFPGSMTPEGDFDPNQFMQELSSRRANERAAQAQTGASERQDRALDARSTMQTEALTAAGDRQDRSINAMGERMTRTLGAMGARQERQIDAQQDGREFAVENRATPTSSLRSLPITAQKEISGLSDVYSLINTARGAASAPGAAQATGLKYNLARTLLPESLEGRGMSTLDGGRGDLLRAQVGNVFSTIGKQLSGGAITASEFQRLEKFLPSADDDNQKLLVKLNNLEREYRGLIERRVSMYGTDYRTPDLGMLLGQPGRETGREAPRAAPAPGSTARPWDNDPGFQQWKSNRGNR